MRYLDVWQLSLELLCRLRVSYSALGGVYVAQGGNAALGGPKKWIANSLYRDMGDAVPQKVGRLALVCSVACDFSFLDSFTALCPIRRTTGLEPETGSKLLNLPERR